MPGGVFQVSLHVVNGAQPVLQLRIVRPLLHQEFQQALRGIVLVFAYLRSRQRVLVSGVVRSLAGRPGERRLRVVEQIHSQAHSTESQKDLGILGLELLRADPVRERTLQFAGALCDRCRLLQRGNRIRLQLQRGIVGVERRPGFVRSAGEPPRG